MTWSHSVRTLRSPALASVVCLAGCGAEPPRPAPPPTEPVQAYRPPPPCRTAEDCVEKAKAALGAELVRARALFELACDKQSVEGCLELGKLLVEGRGGPVDRDRARGAFERLCRDPRAGYRAADCDERPVTDVSSDTCVVDGCAWLASVTPPESAEQIPYAERACAIEGSDQPGDIAMRARACITLAKHHEGAGRAADARRAYDHACAMGDNDGCRVALAGPRPPDARDDASSASRATIEIPSVTTDGLVLEDVSCKLDDSGVVGLLFGVTVAAGFAPHLPALERCSAHPYEAQLEWSANGHRVVELTADVAGTSTGDCVERTLRGAFSTLSGACRAVLVVGSR